MRNFTRQAPLSEQQLAERVAWYNEQMSEAAKVNEAATLSKQQQGAFELQAALVDATQLSLDQLRGIKAWLQHNS
jgi:hypothetical protein